MEQALLALGICCSQLAFDTRTTCCLCCVSKQLGNDLVKQLAYGKHFVARTLLGQAVRQASTTEDAPVLQQLTTAVKWLVAKASIPQQLLADDASQFVNVPQIPKAVVKSLVAAGVRPTYQQLVTAARNQVKGFEGWVAAMKQQGVATGLSIPTEYCCMVIGQQYPEAKAQIYDMTPEQLLDHMYIIVATRLDNILWTGTLMDDLASAPAAKDITLQAAQQLLESTLELCGRRGASVGLELSLHAIIALPPLKTLSTPAIENLLLLAMNNGVPMLSLVEMLITLPAVGQLTSQQLNTLLEAAVPAAVQHRHISSSNYVLQDDDDSYVSILASHFPQAFQLGCQSWTKLLQMYKSAINSLNSKTLHCPVFYHLSQVDGFEPAAAAIPAESVVELAQLLLQICGNRSRGVHPVTMAECLGGIFSLPAARDLPMEELLRFRVVPAGASNKQ